MHHAALAICRPRAQGPLILLPLAWALWASAATGQAYLLVPSRTWVLAHSRGGVRCPFLQEKGVAR